MTDNNETEQWIAELLKLDENADQMTEKQSKILQSAVDVFAEKGFAAASTSEIAQRAGVAEGTIFKHYKTKKDLLLSIIAPTMAKLVAPFVLRGFAKVLDTPYERYEDFLRAMIRNRLEFTRAHLNVIKVLIQEIPFQHELREQFKTQVADKVLTKVEGIVKHFQDKGDIVPIPTVSAIRMTASAALGFIAARLILMPENDWDDEKEIELTIDFILHGLSARD